MFVPIGASSPLPAVGGYLDRAAAARAACVHQRRWALVSVAAPPPGTTTISKETLRDPNLRNATKPFSGVLTAAPGASLSSKKKKNKSKGGNNLGVGGSNEEDQVPTPVAASSTPAAGPPDLEAFSQPLSPIITLDPFARNRVINFAKKVAAEAAGVADGEDESTTEGSDTGTFTTTPTTTRQQRTAKFMCEVRLVAKVPVVGSDGVTTTTTRAVTGVGYANDEKSAQIVAAMHAERCLDELGICVFTLPRMQQKYAVQARAEGRSAPYPNDPPRHESDISTPFPLLHIVPGAAAPAQQPQVKVSPSSTPLDFSNKADQERARKMLHTFERERQMFAIKYNSDPFGTRASGRGGGHTSNAASVESEMDGLMRDLREGKVFADEGENEEEDGVIEVRFEGDEGGIPQQQATSAQRPSGRLGTHPQQHQGTTRLTSVSSGPSFVPTVANPSQRLTTEMTSQSRRQGEKIRQLAYMVDESESGTYQMVDDQVGYLSWPHTTLSPCFFNFGAVKAIEEYVLSYHVLRQLHQLRGIEREALAEVPSSLGDVPSGPMSVQLPPLTTLDDLISVTESEERHTHDVTMATRDVKWFTVTFLVPGIPHHYSGDDAATGMPVNFQPALAKGKAITKEKALALACMHAEFLLDQHHMPLFPLNPIKQLAHHEAALDVGRFAVRPTKEELVAFAGEEAGLAAITAAGNAAMDTIDLNPPRNPSGSTGMVGKVSKRISRPEMTIASIDDLFAEDGAMPPPVTPEHEQGPLAIETAARPYGEYLPFLSSAIATTSVNTETIYMEAFSLALERASPLPSIPRSCFVKQDVDTEGGAAGADDEPSLWRAPPAHIKPLKEWHKVLKRNGEKSRHRYSSLTEEESFMSQHRQFVARHRMHLCEFGKIQDPALLEEMRFCRQLLREFCAAKGEHRRDSFVTFVLTEGSQYRTSYLLPLPPRYGNRGGYAIGYTAETSQLLAALHAVDTLCALCIPITGDPAKYTKLTQIRRANGRIPPSIAAIPVNPLMRSPPAYRETDDSQARPPSHLEAWRVMMSDVSEFDPFKQPSNDPCIQLVRGGEAPLMTILRQIIVNYMAVHGGHPELRMDADKGDMLNSLLGHYNGHQRAGPRAAVAANNYWMEIPVPARFGRRFALGRCIQRKTAQKAFAVHFVRTLFTLGLYPNEALDTGAEGISLKKGSRAIHPILPTKRVEESLQFLYTDAVANEGAASDGIAAAAAAVEKKRPNVIVTLPGQPQVRRQLSGVSDWELWLSLPDGILADLRGSPELHSVMKQQREYEEKQHNSWRQGDGGGSSGVRVTVVEGSEATSNHPKTPPGGKPGIWGDGVWIANGSGPIDEVRFPAAWAVRKHQQLIATTVSPQDQIVPAGIPTPNPVITAHCREIAYSKTA